MTPRSGLSLFELLVALALLALIAAGLAGALNMAVTVWNRSAALNTATQEVALRARLRIWLSQATPPSRLTPFTATFTGTSDRFEFTTLTETPFAPDAAALRVSVETTTDTLTLTALAIDDTGDEIDRFTGHLASSIRPIFSYYDAVANPPGWQPIWDDTSRLPNLVRIDASEGSTPQWPEFTVRPTLR